MFRKYDEFADSEFENMHSKSTKKKNAKLKQLKEKQEKETKASVVKQDVATKENIKQVEKVHEKKQVVVPEKVEKPVEEKKKKDRSISKQDSIKNQKLTKTLTTILIILILIVLIAFITLLYLQKEDSVKVEATPTPTPVVEVTPTPTPTSTPEPTFDISGYDTTSFSSETVIVNKNHKLTASDVPDDQSYIDMPSTITNMTVKSVVNDALNELYAAASSDGIDLYVNQGYISYYYQHDLYTSYANTVGANGQPEMFVPDSGESDYQTGYAVGFISMQNGSYTRLNSSLRSNCPIEQCEGNDAAVWLSENAYKYGFIQRYPEGKQDITGFYGQWYTYRYVGKEVAAAMYESGECMEEFFHIDNN